jgi:hypothetical protein
MTPGTFGRLVQLVFAELKITLVATRRDDFQLIIHVLDGFLQVPDIIFDILDRHFQQLGNVFDTQWIVAQYIDELFAKH